MLLFVKRIFLIKLFVIKTYVDALIQYSIGNIVYVRVEQIILLFGSKILFTRSLA